MVANRGRPAGELRPRLYIANIHRMVRTQIYLTDEEKGALEAIAQRSGMTQSELIRQAVDGFLGRFQEGNRGELLRSGRGLWKDRKNLPDFPRLRRELDRRPKR